MKLFTSNKELEQRITELEAELVSSNDRTAQLEDVQKEMAELRAGFDAERAEFTSQIEAAKIELDNAQNELASLSEQITALKQEAEVTAEKVSLEASRQLASSGHPPIEGVNSEEEVDEFANKNISELQAIAHAMRNQPSKQAAFVTKYIRPLVGKKD